MNLGVTYRPGGNSRRSYHHWWLMGVTIIVDDPELALVLSDTHPLLISANKLNLSRK